MDAPPAPPIEPPTEPTEEPPAPRGRSGRALVVRVALVAAAVVLGSLVYVIVRGSTVDPYDRVATDAGRRILALPGFEERFGEVETAAEAFEFGRQTVADAIVKLDDDALGRYWRATAQLLGGVDDDICGRILRQSASQADAEAAARAVDVATFGQILDVTVEAIEAELNGEPDRPAPTEAELNAAFDELGRVMGEDQVAAAGQVLNDPLASDAQLCAAGRAFLAGVLALPDDGQRVILRFLVA